MTQKKAEKLHAQLRELTGKEVNKERENKKMPAILYGNKLENKNLWLNYNEVESLLNRISESDLVDLDIDKSEPVKVLFHDIQYHPVTHKFIHIDFYQVNMKEKIRTEVELEFVGESPAVKDLGAMLVKAIDRVEIECLPGDLISYLEVDLSVLKEINDIIRVKDLDVPKNIEILTDKETTVTLAEEHKEIEIEEETQEEAPEPEVEGEKKEEADDGEKEAEEKTAEKEPKEENK